MGRSKPWSAETGRTTLRDLRESQVLERLIGEHGAEGVVVGPGDDAAVLELKAGQALVATTDTFVEGAHYLPTWSPPERLGARLVAANLSDLAAMAATPRWALLSIAARPESEVAFIVAIQRGVREALAHHSAAIVGGNLTSVVGSETLTLTLLGEVARNRIATRGGARAGDLLAVTGHPGRSGAGCSLARRIGEHARSPQWQPLLDAWLDPQPRLSAAVGLSESGALHAAIDVSDGLSGALAQICKASAVGVEVDALWPEDPLLARAAATLGTTHDALRFGPSDDYELVLAIDPVRRSASEELVEALGVPFRIVGVFTNDRAMVTRDDSGSVHPIVARSYDAFASPEPKGGAHA